jgi:hypothetical protein
MKHPAIKIPTTAYFRFMAFPPLGKCIDCFLAPEVQSERGPQTATPTGTMPPSVLMKSRRRMRSPDDQQMGEGSVRRSISAVIR